MDPLTIATTTVALCETAIEISYRLRSFAKEVKNVNGNLKAFASEVVSMSRVLKAITTTLNDPSLHLEEISQGPTANSDVWSALDSVMTELSMYLQQLRAKVEDIGTGNEDSNIFKQAIKAFELSLAEDSIKDLRSHLMYHQQNLNTVMSMLHLYVEARLPAAQQPDLKPSISRLLKSVKKLPEHDDKDHPATAFQGSIADPNGQQHSSVTRVRSAAIRIACEAADSPSEPEPTSSSITDHIHRIENWLQRSRDGKHKGLDQPETPESLDSDFSNAASISLESIDNANSEIPLETTPLFSNTSPDAILLPTGPSDDASKKMPVESESIDDTNSETPLVTVSQVHDGPTTTIPMGPETTAILVTESSQPEKPRKTVSFSLHSFLHPSQDSFSPESIKRPTFPPESHSKISTRLRYSVRGLLGLLFLLCITELALWDQHFTDHVFPSGALWPIVMSFLTMAYAIIRAVVAFQRIETLKTLYASMLLWWHIVLQGLLFISWLTAFAYDTSLFSNDRSDDLLPDPQKALGAVILCFFIALIQLIIVAIDVLLWTKERSLRWDLAVKA